MEARYVTEMARRITALLLLEPALDTNYAAVKAETYQCNSSTQLAEETSTVGMHRHRCALASRSVCSVRYETPSENPVLAMTLFTIGYEGRAADELPDSVAAAGVTTLIDVRDLPLSRKRGFSKTALAEHLADSGVEYVHERRLGNPKPLRDYVKSGGDWGWFANTFRERLTGADEALDAVLAIIESGEVVCLLCYEADASHCHRSLVAEALAERADGLAVSHL